VTGVQTCALPISANALSYSNTGLTASTTYVYRLRATNTGGDSAYSNEVSVTTLTSPPTAPSNLNATAVSSTQINLAWKDNSSNETGFVIERKTGSNGTWAQIGTTTANVASFSSTGLSAKTRYYYRVLATNAAGNSAYSNAANVLTR
jgi:predicted phage tail protein